MESRNNIYTRSSVDTIETITSIEFSIASNKLVAETSAITGPEGLVLAEINDRKGEPIFLGVNDKRLGITR
jgi:hypothetical protein